MKAKIWKVIHAIFSDPELDREKSDQENRLVGISLRNGHSGFDNSEQRRRRIYFQSPDNAA